MSTMFVLSTVNHSPLYQFLSVSFPFVRYSPFSTCLVVVRSYDASFYLLPQFLESLTYYCWLVVPGYFRASKEILFQ
jgi:hypothetical protein